MHQRKTLTSQLQLDRHPDETLILCRLSKKNIKKEKSI